MSPVPSAERLGELLRTLVDIPSVFLGEEAVLDHLSDSMPTDGFRCVDAEDGVRCFLPLERRPQTPRLLLAGHADTVAVAGAAFPIVIEGNAPPAPVVTAAPLVQRLRAVGPLPVRPEQAWTPVAEFGVAGIDAVNLGPGDPRYAHTDEEQVELTALVECYDIVRAFVQRPVEG